MPAYIKVTLEESNQKLMNFLQRRFDLSNGEIQKLVRKGEVRINNTRAEAFDRILENDEIRIPPFVLYREKNVTEKTTNANSKSLLEKHSISRIYEDNELLVVSKPNGLATQGGTKQEISLASIIKDTYSNSQFTPTIAHRLDKDTSGLVLIAKSYNCLQELHTALSDKEQSQLQKYYIARIESPNFTLEAGLWKDYLIIQKETNGKEKSKIVSIKDYPNAKIALCETKIIQSNELYTDLEINLITGRKHQIRAQCAHRKIPILGDLKYKGKKSDRLYLHASKIIWKNKEFYSKANWLN